MPEVAAGYGQGQIGQFNVALTKDLGAHFYTPHLATHAESLAPGLKGQNRRVISALHNSREGREKFHSRLNQERFPKLATGNSRRQTNMANERFSPFRK